MSKKKFLTKKKAVGVGILAGILYFVPKGGEWFEFFQTPTNKTNAEQTESQQQSPQQNKTDKQEDKKQETEVKEVDLRMRFINNTLHVGNWPCKGKNELVKAIENIRTKYSNKEVRIKYYKNDKDPYQIAHLAQKLLKQEGFHVTIHTGDSK